MNVIHIEKRRRMQKKGLYQKSFEFKSGEIIDVDKETNVEKEERTFLIH
jgi:hypothetical protein